MKQQPEGRVPELVALLASCPVSATAEDCWSFRGTPLPLRVSSHLGVVTLPEALVTSVRCIVGVGHSIVVCENARDVHVWPGGRREPGESMPHTAVREVHEETGWSLEEDALVQLGFLHYQHRGTPPAAYPYPVPDFLQLVYGAVVTEPALRPARDWTDVDEWEMRSYLADADQLRDLPLSPIQRPFIAAFRSKLSR